MQKLKKILSDIFLDGMSGMAQGLFCTLIVGTILAQIGAVIPGIIGTGIIWIAGMAKGLTGLGIGVGVARKFNESPMVTISAGVAGMVGAFASKILADNASTGSALSLSGPGEPLGAFVAAYVAILFGRLVSGKTKLDILVTPIVTIMTGSTVGLLVGPPISALMTSLGNLINWGSEQQPFLMGIVVSVLMGICLTLPISSAAIGVVLGLSGIAAGAATVGCCAQMIGFAVMSFGDNGFGGLVAQGLGTSMLQIPNIVKKPVIWIPPILTSAVLGPISTKLLGMTSNATGSGMGTAGLVGPIMTYQTMAPDGAWIALLEILAMYFIAPAVMTWFFAYVMRKMHWIQDGDMKLDISF